ncbi:MAG: hypothetical protein ACK5JF_00165 [Oscillospiraceae bacterium]
MPREGLNANWNYAKAPVALSADEWKRQEQTGEYLFDSQMRELKRIIDNFSVVEHTGGTNLGTRNIGIVGDRGTGKTSLAKTYQAVLKNWGYYVFDLVDPSVFEQHLNILEILISNIYDVINPAENLYDDNTHALRTGILMALKKLTKTLANERQKEACFCEKNPPIEVLNEIQNRLALDDTIGKILSETAHFLKTQNKKVKDFVLIIDDIDLLNNTISNNLICDILKYLDTKLIVILCFRESQLQLSLLNESIVEYKELLTPNAAFGAGQFVTLDELSIQNTNKLNKLIPKSHRVYMFSPKELAERSMSEILSVVYGRENTAIGNESYDRIRGYKKTAKEWVYDTVYKRTNLSIKPIDEREETSFFMPTNIRDLLQLAELLESQMQTLVRVDEKTVAKYKSNLEKFYEYFKGRAYEALSPSMASFLKGWVIKDSYQKIILVTILFMICLQSCLKMKCHL